MNQSILNTPETNIQLSGISWNTYESLLKDLSKSRRLKLTYYQGNLEIMTPSAEHEIYKKIIGRFVETLAEELEIYIYPLGSTTLKRYQKIGAEPDECFYIKNIKAIQNKKKIDLQQDPPPDLVIEIDISSSSENRLKIYAEIGVPEVWRYNGKIMLIYQLENQKYQVSQQSLAFPNLPLSEMSEFLVQVETTEYLEIIKLFRNWLKTKIKKNL